MFRTLVILALALPVLGAAEPSAAQDVSVRARIGDVHVGVDTGGFRHRHLRHHRGFRGDFDRRRFVQRDPRAPVLFGSGPVNDFARDQKTREARGDLLRPPPRRFKRQVFVPFLYYRDYRDYGDYSERYVQPPPAPAPEPAPEPPAVAAPEPPDARGPRWATARGRASGFAEDYAVGQPLPQGAPHVTLDWEDYGLPRPLAGQSYVRFGGAVLLIETDSRVVVRVLWPTEG